MRAGRSVVKSMTRYITIWMIEPESCCLSEISKQVDEIYNIYLLSLKR